MSIDKGILFDRLQLFLKNKYKGDDLDLILSLCEKIIHNNHTKNCIVKCNKSDWYGLPKNKSLFYCNKNVGLPIGNLTSQVFGNFYLDIFDHFIKHDLQIKYYGRYVDDMIFVHYDRMVLINLIDQIRFFLDSLKLTLHPHKIYLQHYKKGVSFLGAKILPYRILSGIRTVRHFKSKIYQWNNILSTQKNKLFDIQRIKFLSSYNSYLGILGQYKTYNLKKIIYFEHLSPYFHNMFYNKGGYRKLV